MCKTLGTSFGSSSSSGAEAEGSEADRPRSKAGRHEAFQGPHKAARRSSPKAFFTSENVKCQAWWALKAKPSMEDLSISAPPTEIHNGGKPRSCSVLACSGATKGSVRLAPQKRTRIRLGILYIYILY